MRTKLWKVLVVFALGAAARFAAGLVVGLLAGCGAPFVAVEPEQDQRIVFLVYGAFEAPPDDVCVPAEPEVTTAPPLRVRDSGAP